MIEKLLKNYYKKIAIVVAIVTLLLVSSVLNLYLNYNDDKKSLYLNIDKILQTTANDTKLYLGDDFFNRAIDKDSISENEDMKNIINLSKFTNKINNVEYVYTMTQKDGVIYFTSSSATQEEIEDKDLSYYFDSYDEATPLLKNVLKNNKVVYEEATDKWGTFRTVFIPYTTKKGTKYIVGADIKIDFIQQQLNRYIINSIKALGVLVIILTILIFFFIKISKRELEEISNLKETLELEIKERTEDLNIAKKEIEATHKHTRESIEYASMIQGALLPDEQLLDNYFKDNFVHWIPKDTVGGDIWLFSELRDKNECLLFFIDCTGHGVPGAFVTMIVKAVEREIITNLKKHP
ncbi:MAG: hypothetical protein U9Q30_10565, partial [Campylobacterota bacterium]|nr:hypothetical protein [Campylobacterota bacterium]